MANSPRKLPAVVAQSSATVQRAFLLHVEEPSRSLTSIAKEVGLTPKYLSRVNVEQNWKGITAKWAEERLQEQQYFEWELEAEARRARWAHVRANAAVQELIEAQLNEMVELDEDGNVVALRETVVGHDRSGRPIMGRPLVRDVLALVNALATHWGHTTRITGLEFLERLALARREASRDAPAPVFANAGLLPGPSGGAR